MLLSRLEQETIINFNEAEATAVVETFNGRLKRRLAEIHSVRPDDIKFMGEDQHGAATYEIPKKWIKINPGVKLTEEQLIQKREAIKQVRQAQNS